MSVSRTIYRRGPARIERVHFLDPKGQKTFIFRRWEPMTVRVCYSCENEIPEETLGLAIAINRAADLLPIAQFGTGNVIRDADAHEYDRAPFRKKAGRRGFIQATIDPIQLAEGEYIWSLGLLPNAPGVVEFYEYHHYYYHIAIVRDGHPMAGLIFYPMVHWTHEVTE